MDIIFERDFSFNNVDFFVLKIEYFGLENYLILR
jgi:hypothetical protein